MVLAMLMVDLELVEIGFGGVGGCDDRGNDVGGLVVVVVGWGSSDDAVGDSGVVVITNDLIDCDK